MDPGPASSPAARRALAAAAVAIASLALSFTPASQLLQARVLDLQWRLLRTIAVHPSSEEIVIVGVDPETVRRIAEPRGLWHAPLGMALARIAAARPRAIGLDLPLPDRSQEEARPGSDRALALGLAAARASAPFVATVAIDAASRSARPIHAPFLAVLHEERLGLGLVASDADGVTRRFSLAIPTEDGSFPTLVGRLCRALQRTCRDGFLDFASTPPFRTVPLHQVIEGTDMGLLEKQFQGRIVLVGETLPDANRVAVPVAYAAWETARHDTPEIVVHALALRTALEGTAPQPASRPWVLVLITLGALAAALRFPVSLAAGAAGAAGLVVVGTFALRSGLVLPIADGLVALCLGVAASAAIAMAMRSTPRGSA